MKPPTARYWTALLLVAVTSVVLAAMLGVWITGKFYVYEDIKAILVYEIAGLVFITGFGIVQVIKELRASK